MRIRRVQAKLNLYFSWVEKFVHCLASMLSNRYFVFYDRDAMFNAFGFAFLNERAIDIGWHMLLRNVDFAPTLQSGSNRNFS